MRTNPPGAAREPTAINDHAAAQPDRAGRHAGRRHAVELSAATVRLRRAHAADDAADARADRVAALKAQIEAGAYQIDNAALAEKLLDVL